MKRYFKWLHESDRHKHLIVGFLIGLAFGMNCAFVAGITAEVKDWLWNGAKGGRLGWLKGNGFDWLDLTATMIGGFAGAMIRLLIMYLIWK